MTHAKVAGLGVIGAAGIAWLCYFYLGDSASPEPRPRASVAEIEAPVSERKVAPRREPKPALAATESPVRPASVQVPPPAPTAAPTLDEPSLMNTLRQLGDSTPLYSLQMAREGNARFPDSPDAAERAWYICRSLVNLENFYDAREEARSMVAQYPGTSWADDIERHLLTNPLDLPGDPPP